MKNIMGLFIILFSFNSFGSITVSENGNQDSSEVYIFQGETKLITVDITSDSEDEVLKIYKSEELAEDPSSQDCVKNLVNETCSLVLQATEADIGSKYVAVLSRSNGVTTKKRIVLKIQSTFAAGEYTEAEMSTALTSSSGSTLDFGQVSSGEVFQRIQIKNTGAKNIVQLAPVSMSGKGFKKGYDSCSGQPLDRNQSCSLTVFFNSEDLFSGTYEGQITFKKDGDSSGFDLGLIADATLERTSNKPHLNFALSKNYSPEDCANDELVTDKSACFYEADPIDSSAVQTSGVVCNELKNCTVNLKYQQENEPVEFSIVVNFKDNSAPPEVISYIDNTGSLSVSPDFTDKFSTELNTSKKITFVVQNNSAGGISVPKPGVNFNSSIFTLDGSSTCPSVILKLQSGSSCTFVLSLNDVSQAEKYTDTITISSGDSSTENILDVTGYVLQPAGETKYDNKVYFDSGAVFQ